MSLFATIRQRLEHLVTTHTRKMYFSETDRPPSWLRAELQHESDKSKFTARWRIPSPVSWSGARLLVRQHTAIAEIGLGPLYLQLHYFGPLVAGLKPMETEVFLSDVSLGRLINDDSRIGWKRPSDPDHHKDGDSTSIYIADLLFGKETHATLETKEEVLALTMPDGNQIPMRMRSEYRRRSRPRGARSHYYLRDRSYGPSAEAYHLCRRSGPARTVYDALGEDFADASRNMGLTPWEPDPWHCSHCRGTGMQMDWSRPCDAPNCRDGVMSPDVLMELGFAQVEKYFTKGSPSDLIQAEAYIEFAIGAARALQDHMSAVLLHGSLIYLQLAGQAVERARHTAASGLSSLYAIAEATKITLGDKVFAELEQRFYQALRLAHGDAAIAPGQILLAFERSPVGPRWLTHLSISQQDMIVGAAAAQNLAHDLQLEQSQRLWMFVIPWLTDDVHHGIVSATDQAQAQKIANWLGVRDLDTLEPDLCAVSLDVLPDDVASVVREQQAAGKVNAVVWRGVLQESAVKPAPKFAVGEWVNVDLPGGVYPCEVLRFKWAGAAGWDYEIRLDDGEAGCRESHLTAQTPQHNLANEDGCVFLGRMGMWDLWFHAKGSSFVPGPSVFANGPLSDFSECSALEPPRYARDGVNDPELIEARRRAVARGLVITEVRPVQGAA